LDGVILENVLIPILHQIFEKWAIPYTLEIEREILGRPLENVSDYLRKNCGIKLSDPEIFQFYEMERAAYLNKNQAKIQNGAIEFLETAQTLGLKVMAYGGAPKTYFDTYLTKFSSLFAEEKYIQTRNIRPGVMEILLKFGLGKKNVIFIDEEAFIAEIAKKNGVPFIGYMKKFSYSHQPRLMKELNLRYTVEDLSELDENFLRRIDQEIV
jgi:hypothetical protein